jgi:hypothetical protein
MNNKKPWHDGLPHASKLFVFCGWEIRCPYGATIRGEGFYADLTKPAAASGEPGRGLTRLYKSEIDMFPTAEEAQYHAICYVAKIEGIK